MSKLPRFVNLPMLWGEKEVMSWSVELGRTLQNLFSLVHTDLHDANNYPQRATMWHDEATVVTGNAITKVYHTGTNIFDYGFQNLPANGDSFSNSFLLKAGTYTFYVLGLTNNNCGKIDWYVDGVKVVSLQDWYSASLVFGVVKSTASVTITGDGYHKLVGTVNGANASSVSPYYYVQFLKYWFAPATDPARK